MTSLKRNFEIFQAKQDGLKSELSEVVTSSDSEVLSSKKWNKQNILKTRNNNRQLEARLYSLQAENSDIKRQRTLEIEKEREIYDKISAYEVRRIVCLRLQTKKKLISRMSFKNLATNENRLTNMFQD